MLLISKLVDSSFYIFHSGWVVSWLDQYNQLALNSVGIGAGLSLAKIEFDNRKTKNSFDGPISLVSLN